MYWCCFRFASAWTMAFRWKWHLESWQLWTVSLTSWFRPQCFHRFQNLHNMHMSNFMFSSMIMTSYDVLIVSVHCPNSCRHAVYHDWFEWTCLMTLPGIWVRACRSYHISRTSHEVSLSEQLKWVSSHLRTIHMLPKPCSEMQRSLVCGIHLLGTSSIGVDSFVQRGWGPTGYESFLTSGIRRNPRLQSASFALSSSGSFN